MEDIVHCQMCGTTGGIKLMGMDSRSENGRGLWVAMYSHSTHTDTDKDIGFYLSYFSSPAIFQL
jgi:hypothetical protein